MRSSRSERTRLASDVIGYFERRRQRKEQERKISEAWKTSGAAESSGVPEVPRDLAKKLADMAESSRMTMAQMMVSVAANQVKDGNLRTDEDYATTSDARAISRRSAVYSVVTSSHSNSSAPNTHPIRSRRKSRRSWSGRSR